jgi:acetoacetyl-CoA synthetase
MTTPIWTPSRERIDAANITLFCAQLRDKGLGDFQDYDALWDWSVTDIEAFWSAFWEFAGVVGDKGSTILASPDNLIEAQFFPQAKINYAENLLNTPNDGPAMIFHSEVGVRSEWSWKELRDTVSRLQQALRSSGVGVGDRVAGIVPNSPFTIAAALAAASLGAVWSSCSPDFGFNAAMDRISQVEPKVLFCADGYTYNGKEISCIETAEQLTKALPSVLKTVIFPLNGTAVDLSGFEAQAVRWDDYIQPFTATEIIFERVAFDAPLFIMFSSGTTGLPKCIVHSVGGTLIQHLKELKLQADLKPNDRLMYFTTCGWMMWNWMISGLGCGATLVLFDGSPFYPDGNRLADIAAAEHVTHFGTSAKYLDACSKSGIVPIKTHDLTNLRTLLSTGSPLSDAGFDYVYSAWKKDICLSSIAGGTDILGCFVGGSPISPVYRGECQKRHLGMNVQVFDEHAAPIQGAQGELVCLSPHPSMPIGFWSDEGDARYKAAYFETYENIWHQGDFVELTAHNGLRFYGRSDAVLNPGGVRIGTAEIYRIVENMDEVLEGVVIGQTVEDDQRVVLFVRLAGDAVLDEALTRKIKSLIRANATPRHVPAIILQTLDIPRTKSGKIAEIAVRDTVDGRPVKNTASLANPEALALYENLPDLTVSA